MKHISKQTVDLCCEGNENVLQDHNNNYFIAMCCLQYQLVDVGKRIENYWLIRVRQHNKNLPFKQALISSYWPEALRS